MSMHKHGDGFCLLKTLLLLIFDHECKNMLKTHHFDHMHIQVNRLCTIVSKILAKFNKSLLSYAPNLLPGFCATFI